ncbi:MAG TPA: hypothetical protein PK771_06950 [Spirochaetota bacterium]|nr:hypothetical protein [Spirochaetota bacterium]
MKKLISILLLSIALFFSFISLTGCPTPESTTTTSTTVEQLVGYWKSSYGDGFEVKSGTTKMFYQYDDKTKAVSFAGEIVNSASLSAETGFLTVKITDKGSWFKTEGEYLVIRWKNLATNIVKQSAPYKQGGKSTCATPTEAESEFTETNGYYGYFGEYDKQ